MTRRRKLTGAPLRSSEKREPLPAPPPEPNPADPAPPPIVFRLRASARSHAEEALEALMGLVRTAASEHVRVSAANAILDRAHGKPLTGVQAAEEGDDGDDEDGEVEVIWLAPKSS